MVITNHQSSKSGFHKRAIIAVVENSQSSWLTFETPKNVSVAIAKLNKPITLLTADNALVKTSWTPM
jgi:hypothetical protein